MGSRWQVEKKKDTYYKKAKKNDYRSRASYKLLQLNKKFKIIKEGYNVIDLGAAPGGWSQVALNIVGPEGKVVAIDLNRIRPFEEDNFYRIKGDFTEEDIKEEILDILGEKANVIMSDASPSLTGIKNIDQLNSADLVNSVLSLKESLLVDKGNLVMKLFQGSEYPQLVKNAKKDFKIVKTTKPASSRKQSSEMYLVGLKYKAKKSL